MPSRLEPGRRAPTPPLQAQATTAADLLAANAPPAAVYAAFEAEVFAGREARDDNVFIDAQGERIAITDGFFRVRATGKSKLDKDERGIYARLLARTLRHPAQIWQDNAKEGKWRTIRRRYLARWNIAGAGEEDLVVIVEQAAHAPWIGVTAFRVDRQGYLLARLCQGIRCM